MPSVEGCRVMFWIVISGGAARLLFMAVYSVVVYVIVKTGTQNVKFTFVVISVKPDSHMRVALAQRCRYYNASTCR